MDSSPIGMMYETGGRPYVTPDGSWPEDCGQLHNIPVIAPDRVRLAMLDRPAAAAATIIDVFIG
jgi:hypothetical protein